MKIHHKQASKKPVNDDHNILYLFFNLFRAIRPRSGYSSSKVYQVTYTTNLHFCMSRRQTHTHTHLLRNGHLA